VDEEAGQGSVTASHIASRKFAEFTLAIRILNHFSLRAKPPPSLWDLMTLPSGRR
jgi:hypothetical protein